LLVAVVHGMSNFWSGYLDSYRGSMDNIYVYGAMFVVVGLIVLLLFGSENLSRKHKRNVLALEEA